MTELEVSKPSLWVPIPGMYGVSYPVALLCLYSLPDSKAANNIIMF